MNEETTRWMQTASSEDISLAIELGYPSLLKLKSAIQRRDCVQVELPVRGGQIGEEFVESLLKKRFPNIANVTKTANSGDLTLFIQHRKIIVEIKNYSNNVPSSGVEKFQRDLSTTNACGGVFVSLKSPIAGVTADFTIRYENAITKIIPCAYIVSSDENNIIMSVNMISQLCEAFNYLNAEMYNRDTIISGVYSVAERLDEISRIRNEIQANIGTMTSSMMKSAMGLVTAESGIRKAIDSMRSELFHINAAEVEPAMLELEKNAVFARHSVETKALVAGVMKSIQATLHRGEVGGTTWKLTAKKCVNPISGIGFNLLIGRIDIIIPREKISSDIIIDAMNIFGKKVSIDDNFCIELNSLTYEWICQHIRGISAVE